MILYSFFKRKWTFLASIMLHQHIKLHQHRYYIYKGKQKLKLLTACDNLVLFCTFDASDYQFLARLYESTGRAIALATTSALALHKMLKFLVKVFKSLYLLNPWMDLVDTLPDARYWSEGLCCAITTHVNDLQGHRLWNFKLKFLVKVFEVFIFWSFSWILLILCLMLDTGLKFYGVPSRPTSVTLRSRSRILKF